MTTRAMALQLRPVPPRPPMAVPLSLQCGPRFELKLYQIRLGTLDQPHADNEWVLRSYTRNSKKSKLA